MALLGIIAAAMLFPTQAPAVSELEAEDLETVVYFDYGSEVLGDAGLELVRGTASAALQAGFTQATVVGHADKAGPEAQNFETGMARAEAVAFVMIAAGFAADNVEVESAGETDPAINHEDERREPRNRRAVITFDKN
ncbi:MAG: OmpA family protein [Parvularculaceae bacterium]|nr:OmpA family protein [Parvularculaceae bacterium]